MPKASQIVRQIIVRGQFRLRITLAQLFEKQRKELPIRGITNNKHTPAELIDKWQEEFIKWFTDREQFWRNIWNTSIRQKQERKITPEEAFDDFLTVRAGELALDLAVVNSLAIDNVIRHHTIGSVTRLDRALRDTIGLRPDQFNAFVREAAAIDKRFPDNPARARAIKDRIYQKKINYRSQLIARTEISNGVNTAQMADITSRVETGDLPEEMEKRWSTINDDVVSDGCLENQADGWIPLDGTFTSGHERPPRFPSCRCGLQFRVAKEAA